MEELNKILVALYGKNIRNLLHINVTQDIKDSNKNTIYVDPHELSFPKENYDGTDEFSLKNQKPLKPICRKYLACQEKPQKKPLLRQISSLIWKRDGCSATAKRRSQ